MYTGKERYNQIKINMILLKNLEKNLKNLDLIKIEESFVKYKSVQLFKLKSAQFGIIIKTTMNYLFASRMYLIFFKLKFILNINIFINILIKRS